MKLFKIPLSVLIITCCVLALELVNVVNVIGGIHEKSSDAVIQQDSSSIPFIEERQDSARINSDSLEKLVPYIDEVKADSKNELYFLYFIAIIISTWFSEDLACIGAGIMAANGLIEFWPASFAAIIGIYIGDFMFYFAGRLLGTSILEIAPFKWFIKKENVKKTVEWFRQKGPVMLIASRFIPGSRIPVYLSAGILKTGFWRFMLYFGITTLLWTPVFVWISVIAGNEILSYYEAYDDYAIWILIAAILILWVLFRLINPLFTKR
ncbi:MAG: DedA family protein, partial [Balneolaceae bacterium]